MTILIAILVFIFIAIAGAFFITKKRKRFSDSRKGSTAALASVWNTVSNGEMSSLSERLAIDENRNDSNEKMTLEELSALSNPFPSIADADWEDPSFLRAEVARAISLEKSGEHEASLACLDHCALSFPSRAEPILRAALICFRSADFERLAEYRRRLSLLSSSPLAALRLIESLNRESDKY